MKTEDTANLTKSAKHNKYGPWPAINDNSVIDTTQFKMKVRNQIRDCR